MNELKTYWHLTERERAALTREDMERFIDAELMTKGVLKVKPLELVTVPEMPEPDVTVYAIHAGYHTAELAFPTAEAAAQAAGLACATVGVVWFGSEHEGTYEALKNTPSVKPVKVYSQYMLTECRAQIDAAKAAKAENERRTKEHEAQSKAVREALAGMWEDWHACLALTARMSRILETFNEYKATAGGSEEIAARFLKKVFTREEIMAAAEWTGTRIPLTASDDVPEPPPMAFQKAANTDDIPI